MSNQQKDKTINFQLSLNVLNFSNLLERSKDANLIQGILFLFDTKFSHFYLSEEIRQWLTFKLYQKNNIEKSADEFDGMSNYEYEN